MPIDGQPFPLLGSRAHPKANPGGSVDIYMGPKAPAGKKSNWLATVPCRGFFAVIRLYSPTEATFDGSWKPSDIEEVSAGTVGQH